MKNQSKGDGGPPAFRIWLCGAFRVERLVGAEYEAVRTVEWGGSSYPRLLLKALLCCPSRQARRESLIEMLWPDTDPDQAAQYLNTATTKLRKVLQPVKEHESLLTTENDSRFYCLEGQILLWIDGDAAFALLKEAECIGRTSSKALSLLEEADVYFSKGLFLQDEEGQWATGRRATMEQARYRCRLWLAEAYEEQRMPGQAETALSLLLEEDPTDEDVLCRLMLLLHQQGRTHQSLRLYEQASQIFEKEGMELAEATRILAEQLRQERWVPLITHFGIEESISFFSPRQNALHDQTLIVEELGGRQSSGLMIQSPGEIATRHNIVRSAQQKIAFTSKAPHSSTGDLVDVGIQALFLVGQQEYWSSDEMRDVLDQVLRKYRSMAQEEQKAEVVSRRDVLMLLTGISGALLGLNATGNTSPFLVEETLSICVTAIPACWNLVYAGGIEHIEQVLPQYLSHLTSIAQRSSHHQKLAAGLAAQGYKLANLLDLQREDFITALKHSKDALTFGQLAEDLNLQIAALIEEALTFWYRKRPQQTLEAYQKALKLLPRRDRIPGMNKMISPIIAGRVYGGLAEVYAQLEQEQEALKYMGLAQDTFPDYPENDPHFSYTHYDHYYLYLYQGLMYMKLNQPNQALSAYAHFNGPKYAPRRAEITNREAAAWLAAGDMHQCYEKVEAAVSLAISMDSDLRYSEAQEVYQGMQVKWPHEQKVKRLAQVFQR